MSGWLFDFFVSPGKAEFYPTTAETRSPPLSGRHVYRPYRSGRKMKMRSDRRPHHLVSWV
jgi:hypothetical protein